MTIHEFMTSASIEADAKNIKVYIYDSVSGKYINLCSPDPWVGMKGAYFCTNDDVKSSIPNSPLWLIEEFLTVIKDWLGLTLY